MPSELLYRAEQSWSDILQETKQRDNICVMHIKVELHNIRETYGFVLQVWTVTILQHVNVKNCFSCHRNCFIVDAV